jgi:hypothetical protein
LLLNVDHLAARVQRPMHLHPLAFEFRHLILVIGVISRATLVLKNVLVS